MAEYDKMFGNMSSEEYEAWATMSPEEKRELANRIAFKKRQEEKARQDQANAEDRAFRASAMKPKPEAKQEVFNEMYGPDSTYAKIAKESAKEIMGGDEPVIRRSGHPTVRKVQSMTSDAGGSIISNPTHPAVQLKNKKIAEEDAIADARMESALQQDDPDLLLEKPSYISQRVWDDLPISQRRKVLANIERTESKANLLSIPESEVFDEVYTEDSPEGLSAKAVANEMSSIITPRDQSPPENIPDSREEYVEKVNKMVEEGKITKEEANRVLKGNERFPIITPRDQRPPENIPDSRDEYVEKVEQMIAEGKLDANSPEVGRILGSGYDPEAELIASEYEAEGLMNVKRADNKVKEKQNKIEVKTLENAIKESKKKSTTGDFVRYDENGYPIYKKGSKWGKSFNDAYGRALEKGESTFSWTGHDGKLRKYTNDQAEKKIDEAPAPKLNDPSTLFPQVRKSEYAVDPSDLIPQITKYKSAKTKKEKEEALPKPEDKYKRASVKEQADRYWVDPRTGFALNLSAMDRRIDRKDAMEMASLFPAADRAAYLWKKGMIDKEDFDMITKNSKLKEELNFKLKGLQIKEAQLKIVAQERKNKIPPERKELVNLYTNAVTNDDYEMQELLGVKLGFPEDVLKLSRTNRKRYELNKLKGKKGVDGFKNLFMTPYSNVVNKKDTWIKRAASVVYKEGVIDLYDIHGKKYTDRRGFFKGYGLFEQNDMLKQPNRAELLRRMPFYSTIKSDPDYLGSDGKFNADKFIKDNVAYEGHLLKGLVYNGMDDAYSGQWANMLKYIQVNQPTSGQLESYLLNLGADKSMDL